MLILTETTDNLQVVLGGNITTNQLRCMSSWRDITTTAYTAGRTLINTNNTTDVNVVPAPAASTQRVIDYLSVYNQDTTNAVVTIKYDANGTETNVIVVTLASQERLEYIDGQGFRVLTNSGAVKSSATDGTTPISSSIQTTILGTDVTNSNGVANTIADVTGLSFAVTSGVRYWFRFVIQYTAAATTTGSRWSINGPGSPTELRFCSQYSLTTTSNTFNTLIAYDAPAASNTSSATTTSNIAIIEGFIRPSANGTVIARFASEVLSSAIVAKAGSQVQFMSL